MGKSVGNRVLGVNMLIITVGKSIGICIRGNFDLDLSRL
jgi:hypothetical protein